MQTRRQPKIFSFKFRVLIEGAYTNVTIRAASLYDAQLIAQATYGN